MPSMACFQKKTLRCVWLVGGWLPPPWPQAFFASDAVNLAKRQTSRALFPSLSCLPTDGHHTNTHTLHHNSPHPHNRSRSLGRPTIP